MIYISDIEELRAERFWDLVDLYLVLKGLLCELFSKFLIVCK